MTTDDDRGRDGARVTTDRTPHLGPDAAERISAGCYGALIAASTLIGLADVDLWSLIALVVLTNVAYWATHVFAYTLGDRGESGESVTRIVAHHARVSAPMVSATFAPLLVVLLLGLVGVSQETSVLVGVLVALLFLVGVATTGASLRRLPPIAIALIAVVTLVLSAALVLLKLSLH